MARKIRLGMVRCDTHGYYFGALMARCDPLLLEKYNKIVHFYATDWYDPKHIILPTVSDFEIVKCWDAAPARAEELSATFLGTPQVCATMDQMTDGEAHIKDQIDLKCRQGRGKKAEIDQRIGEGGKKVERDHQNNKNERREVDDKKTQESVDPPTARCELEGKVKEEGGGKGVDEIEKDSGGVGGQALSGEIKSVVDDEGKRKSQRGPVIDPGFAFFGAENEDDEAHGNTEKTGKKVNQRSGGAVVIRNDLCSLCPYFPLDFGLNSDRIANGFIPDFKIDLFGVGDIGLFDPDN